MTSKSVGSILAAVLGLAALLSIAVPAWAARQRTFVAADPLGNDANAAVDCILAQPCRTFNVAIPHTTPGGELIILGTAGYGPMTIDRSIKIVAPSGVYGGISVQGGAGSTTGVLINAGDTDVITLRGLDISGVPGAAPLPLYGIDIQNAGAVHIEKSSIGNFSQDTSACINITSTQGTDVHVDDSFLRECRTGIFATGTNHHVTVSVDHTRIQTGLGTVPTGIHLQGEVDLSLRNSTISLNDVGLQMDNLQPGADLVAISNSEIVGNLTGILVNNTTASAVSVVSISGSQIVASDNAVLVSNSAVGGNTWVETMDSVIGFTGNNGLVLSNSAADANTLMSLSMERSRVANTAGTAVTLNATNGSAIDMHVRDSTFIGAQTLLKTVGTASQTYVSLIRSNLSHAGTAIDHGQGNIELDSTHVNLNVRDFVNNGSGSIVSNGQNMVHNNNNPAGPTYITPAIIPLK